MDGAETLVSAGAARDRARTVDGADADRPGPGIEVERVLVRLERIRELSAGAAPAPRLLGELRALLAEAEDWAGLEGDERARTAVTGLGTALAESGEVSPGEVAVGLS